MLTRRIVQLTLLPLTLLVCDNNLTEPLNTPVAAALVSGENSDLGERFGNVRCFSVLSLQENTRGT